MIQPLPIAVAGLAALAVAMGIGRFAFTPILPMMQADGGIGVVEGGWLASANYLGYLAGALAALGMQRPASWAIRGSLVVVGVTTLAMGHTTQMGAWMALRFVAGVASAWVLVFASAWCLDRFQGSARSPLLGATLYSGVGVGIAVAGGLCLALILLGRPSSDAWTTLGVIALAAALALPRGFGMASPAAGRPSLRKGALARGSLRLILCYGAFGFGYIIPATFIATMARDADPALYGWSWPVFGLTAASTTFAAAWARRRVDERRVWIAAQWVMALGVVSPVLVRGLGGILVCALLVGGTFMVITMAGMQEARRIAGTDARPLMAAMTAAFAAGQVAGPLLVSALASGGSGYDAALLVSGALLVASAAALVSNPPKEAP